MLLLQFKHKIKAANTGNLIATTLVYIWTITLQSCFHHWSAEEKKNFQTKCEQTDTVSYLTFSLTGFTYSEVDTIMIKEVQEKKIIDSFYVQIPASSFDKARNRYWGRIERPLKIKNSYQFCIQNHLPYELTNMKMMMWPQWTMTSEGYGCVIGEYAIDGVKFEKNASPDFVNRDSAGNETIN